MEKNNIISKKVIAFSPSLFVSLVFIFLALGLSVAIAAVTISGTGVTGDALFTNITATSTTINISNGNITGSLTLGTPLAITSGGTGISAAPVTTGQLLMASSTGWVVGNLVAGSNIAITTSTTGQITIADTLSSGVSSSSPFSAGYISFATSAVAITNSNIYQNGSNIGIGTTTPSDTFDVNGYVSYFSPYGSLIEETPGNTTGSTIILNSSGTFVGWTGASSTLSMSAGGNYITNQISSGATSTMTIGSKGGGIYRLSLGASLSISVSNHRIHCTIFDNGVEIPQTEWEIKNSNAADVQSAATASTFKKLNSGDVLDGRCDDETGASTITIQNFSLGMNRISK